MAIEIVQLQKNDFVQWSELFRAYIDFYKSSLPDEQYQRTFARILDTNKDLYGVALKDTDANKLIGIAHYYPHQDPWIEQPLMHLNDLFVDPTYRGRGFGRKLMLYVADEGKKAGCARLEWDTQYGNPARKLYDQVGKSEFVGYQRGL